MLAIEIVSCLELKVFVCLFVSLFVAGFLYVALAILELALQIRLGSNSEIHLTLTPKSWNLRCVPPSLS